MTAILPDIFDEANRLVSFAQQEDVQLRLIGGLAVRMHSPNVARFNTRREYADIDFVTSRSDGRRLEPFFQQMGYPPDKAFNALNGSRRQLYHDPQNNRHVDIFVGDFEMCHRLPLNDRLGVHPTTIPLAELFLSKTQIVQLNRKDALDLLGLLLDNEIGQTDNEAINVDRIAYLCAQDWGLYQTTMMNLARLDAILQEDDLGLDAGRVAQVQARIQAIRDALVNANKPLTWKARDRVGTRIRWYAEVEEVNREDG